MLGQDRGFNVTDSSTYVVRILLSDVLRVVLQLLFHHLGSVLVLLLTGDVRLISCRDALATGTNNWQSLFGNVALGRAVVGGCGALNAGRNAVLWRDVTQDHVFGAQVLLGVFDGQAGRVFVQLLLSNFADLLQVLHQSQREILCKGPVSLPRVRRQWAEPGPQCCQKKAAVQGHNVQRSGP